LVPVVLRLQLIKALAWKVDILHLVLLALSVVAVVVFALMVVNPVLLAVVVRTGTFLVRSRMALLARLLLRVLVAMTEVQVTQPTTVAVVEVPALLVVVP
jgi:hypothetical protein